jgi:hypothetical protein
MSSSCASQPYETPLRANSFFTHLNHDIRCLVYDLLELPPISHQCLGFVMSCQQALNETERAAVRNLNLYLTNVVAWYELLPCRPLISHFSPNARYSHLKEITVTITSVRSDNKQNEYFSDLLGCYFSKVTFQTKAAKQSGETAISPRSQEDEVDTKLVEPLTVHTSYSRADSFIFMVIFLLDRTQPYIKARRKRPTALDSRSVHVKTIAVAWGEHSQDNASEFENIGVDYNNGCVQGLNQQKESDLSTHSWPTVTQLCRKDGLAHIFTVSSENRWNDPFNKSPLFRSWITRTKRRQWLEQRRNAWPS